MRTKLITLIGCLFVVGCATVNRWTPQQEAMYQRETETWDIARQQAFFEQYWNWLDYQKQVRKRARWGAFFGGLAGGMSSVNNSAQQWNTINYINNYEY